MLWRKLPGARSAGRVQSVALRLVVEREAEIEAFKAQEYWSIDADVATGSGGFPARLIQLDGKKLEKLSLANEADAKRAVDAIQAQRFTIGSVEAKPVKRNPSPPFITSTLQQEASRKLGFNAKRTMQVAQGLYEGVDIGGETTGLITYMRTDGVTMVAEAITEARDVIGEKYGARYVPGAARIYTSKAKNAQEAHEAMRPTSFARTPEEVARYLDGDAARLYELIWKRAVASQMESAEQERTTVDVISADKKITLRATGTVTLFDGFLTLYLEGQDDASDEEGSKLPKVAAGDAAKVENVTPAQHFTEPPPRYSEASLVKKLEELGIGRPSTYASILSTLRDRAYVRMDRGRFLSRRQGPAGHHLPEQLLHRYVEYDFTADLEEKLDEVSAGKLDWKQLLRDFWKDFSAAVGETKDLKIRQVIDELDSVLGPHIFPGRRRRRRSAQMPVLRQWAAESEAGPLRRLCRLHQLSGMQIHPPDRRQAGRRRCRPARAGPVPRHRPAGDPALGPLRALCAAGRRQEAQAQRPAQGHRSRRSGSGHGGEAFVAAARSRRASRRRQEDHRQFRPLRALCRP